MNLVQLAGMLPRDIEFREYLACRFGGQFDVERSAQAIRDLCQVASRSQLAREVDAARRFEHLVRRPFIEWRDEQFESQ